MTTITEPGVLSRVQLRLVDNLDTLDECRRWLSQPRDVLGCDTETGSTDIWHDPHRMTQLGDLWHGWAFPPGWFGAVNEMLSRYTGRIGFFNSPFDWQVLATHEGVTPAWERTDDAQLAGHIYSSNATHRNGLKERSTAHVDPTAADLDAALQAGFAAQGWDYGNVPFTFPPYWRYAAQDPVLNCHLLARYLPVVRSQHAASYDLELAYARLCANMMTAGMMIDRKQIGVWIGQVNEHNEKMKQWLRTEHGLTGCESNEQVGRALAAQGVECLRTPTGLPKADKETLALYASRYPQAAALINTIRWVKKGDAVRDRYLQKFLDLAVGDVIHASIHPTGAFHTGRSSVKTPAMQTFDRDLPWIRGSFVPRPGHVFISIDADQIEARLAADFSGDRQLIADFAEADATGQSFFLIQAAGIYGGQISKKDPRYTTTKNAFYSWQFGAGLDTAAATAGVTPEQMRPAYEGIKARYPGVQRLMNKIIAENRRRGHRRKDDPRSGPYVTTVSGKRLYGEGHLLYPLMDYKIQGSAADVLKWGGVALDAAGYGEYLRLSIHDEWLMEAPEDIAPRVLREATETLTDRTSFAVPLTWSGTILPDRWEKT